MDEGLSYGGIIRQKRKEKKLTLEKVGRCIRSGKGYMSGIENGKVPPPSPAFTMRLCKLLDLEPHMMLALAWAQKAPKLIRDDMMAMVMGRITVDGFSTPVAAINIKQPAEAAHV